MKITIINCLKIDSVFYSLTVVQRLYSSSMNVPIILSSTYVNFKIRLLFIESFQASA